MFDFNNVLKTDVFLSRNIMVVLQLYKHVCANETFRTAVIKN